MDPSYSTWQAPAAALDPACFDEVPRGGRLASVVLLYTA
jgi:hypothetical protein